VSTFVQKRIVVTNSYRAGLAALIKLETSIGMQVVFDHGRDTVEPCKALQRRRDDTISQTVKQSVALKISRIIHSIYHATPTLKERGGLT
jgi:hypothetical protein